MPHTISYSSLIPPNLFILAALIGTLLAWRSWRFGLWLATAAIGWLSTAMTVVGVEEQGWSSDWACSAHPTIPASSFYGEPTFGAAVIPSCSAPHAR